MKLKEYPTNELVEELSKREGIERLETPVEGQDEIAIEKNRDKSIITTKTIKDNYSYDELKSGPAIILRIID